jgi:non-heme chloroperoxidase
MAAFNPVRVLVLTACVGGYALSASAQAQGAWTDPSPHRVQFVHVDEDVNLEVLDWGGSGRPIVLLTGLGNTAHVFDDFAPKLRGDGHIYGVTRRGYGQSSVPASGYGADRLADDVLAVIGALQLDAPILVGHSIAGQELSSIASRHPERVGGVVYLDALWYYSYLTPEEAALRAAVANLQVNLQLLASKPLDSLGFPRQPEAATGVLRTMDALQQRLRPVVPPPAPLAPSAPPSPADLESYPAYRSWYARTRGFQMPESETRQTREPQPDGRVGPLRTPPAVPGGIRDGEKTFTTIRVPALAVCAIPLRPDPGESVSDNERASAIQEARARALETNVPGTRVVRVPNAHHYIFISDEPLVLRELHTFVASLN